jgi:hypothetical protein
MMGFHRYDVTLNGSNVIGAYERLLRRERSSWFLSPPFEPLPAAEQRQGFNNSKEGGPTFEPLPAAEQRQGFNNSKGRRAELRTLGFCPLSVLSNYTLLPVELHRMGFPYFIHTFFGSMFIFRASVYTAENCNIHTIRLS